MTSLRLLAACFAALALSLSASAATVLDDSFSDGNSLNQNLTANSVQIFKARTGTTRTDAVGSVAYAQTQTGAEAHWFHFTEVDPIVLQVGDSLTASVTFSLTAPVASGGTVRFGLFDSKKTRVTADKTGGHSDANLSDDLGYLGQLSTDANASVGPFTYLGRRDTIATANLFNSTADFPALSDLVAGSTERVALAGGTSYTLSMKVQRQSATVNVVTLSIAGGGLPVTYTYVGTDSGTATSSYAFDWFGFRYSGSNLAGTVTFTNVKVVQASTVSSGPVITTQPANQTVNVGANATFTVAATGTALTYQWFKDGVAIGSAIADTLTLSNVQASAAGSYTVKITNAGGNVTSAAAVLTVNTPAVAPAISAQPVNQTVTAGGGASFSVVATGTAPLTYQWKKDGVNIAGATSSTYTIASTVAADAGSYTVLVTNSVNGVTSAAATLTVNAASGNAPTLTAHPVSRNVVSGAPVTLSVSASGASLTYQWKKNGADIAGATESSLVFTNASSSDSGNYTVAVINGGGSVTSNVARLSVAPAGALGWQSYTTTGARVSADAAVFDPATGVYTFTIPGNTTHTFVTSSFVPLVLAKPASGSVTLPVSFSMSASGGYGTSGSVQFAYTGFGLFNNGGTPAAATGNFTDDKGLWIELYQSANAVSMKPQSVTNTVPFCPAGLMALDINTPYGMGTGTGGALGTINDNLLVDMIVRPAAFSTGVVQLGTNSNTVAVSGGVLLDHETGGNVLNRRVYSSASSGLSVTNASITFNEFGYQFQNATANPVTLQLSSFVGITPPPYFTTQPPSSMIVTVGESLTLATVAAGSPTSYQWQLSTDGGANFTDINAATNASATTATLTIVNAQLSTAGIYQLIATNPAGATASSQVTVSASATPFAPVIAIQPAGKTVNAGVAVTLSVTASGTAPLAYQWRKSTDGGSNYTDVAGATGASLTFGSPTIADNGSYVVRLTNAQGTLISSPAILTVNQAPVITTQPGSATPAPGASVTLSVVAAASPSPTYQWKKNGVSIAGATASSLALANVTGADTGNYTVVVSNAAGSVTSAIASVNVISSTVAVANFTPARGATAVLPDAPLTLTFNQGVAAGLSGTIKIYDAAAPATPVDIIDFTSAGARTASAALLALPIQTKTIGTLAGFAYYPVTISGSTVTIYPRNLSLTYGKTYYVTVDAGTFTDVAGGLAFPGVTNSTTWTFTTKAAPATGASTYTVAKDGSGDFASVQAALDFIPANNTTPTTILIKNGTYNEIVYWVSKNQLTIMGESRTGTIVGYANNNTLNPQGTNGRAAFEGRSSTGTVLTNLTVKNFTPRGGSQAEAIYFNNAANAQTIITGVDLISFQDTLNVNGPTYISNTYIEGDVDFMWGGGPVFFEKCELKMLTSAGYFTQVRNSTANHGFVYVNCLFSAAPNVTNAYLGRLDQNAPAQTEMVLINCVEADGLLLPAAWDLNSNTAAQAQANTLCVEYNATKQSNGAAIDPTGRASWSYQWSQPANASQITNYSNVNWVLNTTKAGAAGTTAWTPALAPYIVAQPVGTTINAGQALSLNVGANGIPVATYQWRKNGTNIPGATAATYTVASTTSVDSGVYSVVVTNSAGSATSANAVVSIGAVPTIATQPVALSANVGGTASFSVVAGGTGPFTYQWQKNSVNITGATLATYAISPVQTADAASYRVIVTNGSGSTTSSAATLTVTTVFAAPAADGFAASVTGGGTTGTAVNATTAADFRTFAEDNVARTITVAGTLNLGTKVSVKSNKTIQGIDDSATLVGNLELASGVSNVVIRGLNITNPAAGGDGISVAGATNVYITHCTIFDCADGLIDITAGADNITVSWCEFYYTAAQTAHRFAMTIGGVAGETKALRVSLHHNWWSDRIDQSLPSTTYGQVHMYNDFIRSTGNTSGTAVLANSQLLSERNQYTSVASPLTKTGGLIRANNNVYTTVTGAAADGGTDAVFTPGYSYEMLAAADVGAVVQAGAGNTAGAASGSLPSGSASISASATVIAVGTPFTLTALPAGFTGTAYQWRINNAPIAGATSPTYTVASAQAANAGAYSVVVTRASGDVVSSPWSITVATTTTAPSEAPKKSGGGAPSLWFFAALSVMAAWRRIARRSSTTRSVTPV